MTKIKEGATVPKEASTVKEVTVQAKKKNVRTMPSFILDSMDFKDKRDNDETELMYNPLDVEYDEFGYIDSPNMFAVRCKILMQDEQKEISVSVSKADINSLGVVQRGFHVLRGRKFQFYDLIEVFQGQPTPYKDVDGNPILLELQNANDKSGRWFATGLREVQ